MPGFNIPLAAGCPSGKDAHVGKPISAISPSFASEAFRKHRYRIAIYKSSKTNQQPEVSPTGYPIDPANSTQNPYTKSNATFAEREMFCYAYKCTRPISESDVITIHHGQQEIYRPGKHRWRPVEFTFYDVMDNAQISTLGAGSPTRYMYDWWGGVKAVGGMVNRLSGIHNAIEEYHRTVEIEMLDGDGIAVWTYVLEMAWPELVTPSELSYADTEIAEVSVTLRYNRAIEK